MTPCAAVLLDCCTLFRFTRSGLTQTASTGSSPRSWRWPRVSGRGTRAERVSRTLAAQWTAARHNGVVHASAEAALRDRSRPLSEREFEVARLIAQDLTNRGIAAELGRSEGTVRVHVEHILRKLGLQSRAQVAHWVREQVG